MEEQFDIIRIKEKSEYWGKGIVLFFVYATNM